MIRPLDPAADAPAIARIYAPFVTDTDISFESVPPTAEEMSRRLKSFVASLPGFVWEEGGEVVAYAYAHPWKGFAGYSQTLETTLYVDPPYARRGIGRALMERLIDEGRRHGIISFIACITYGNTPSCALHEALGFTLASHFRAVGRKNGRLLDILDYQLLL